MTTIKSYYKITARKNGRIAASWKTTDINEALRFFEDYTKTYEEANAAFRKTRPEEKPYKISITYKFKKIKYAEV